MHIAHTILVYSFFFDLRICKKRDGRDLQVAIMKNKNLITMINLNLVKVQLALLQNANMSRLHEDVTFK